MADVHGVFGPVDRLEEMMMQVAYEHTKTEMALRDLKHEMSNFKRIIPLFSSLYLPKDIVNLLTKNKVFALAMGEDTMQVLNLEMWR